MRRALVSFGRKMVASVQRSWSRIRAWLGSNAPSEIELLGRPAEDSAIEAHGKELPFPLPADLRASARVCDGQHGSAIAGHRLFSIAEAIAERHRLTLSSVSPATWQPHWLPILTDGGGNYHFVDLTSGAVHGWDHERSESRAVAPSFAALLAWYADALERGVYEVTEEGVGHEELDGPGGLCRERPELLERLLEAELPLEPQLWKELSEAARPELLAATDAWLARSASSPARDRATLLRAWLVGREGGAWCESLLSGGDDLGLATRAYAASKCFTPKRARTEVLALVERYLGTPRAPEALAALSVLADPKMVEWCEERVAAPVEPEWGLIAASANLSWSVVEAWLAMGSAHGTMALDALLYAQPRGRRIAKEHGLVLAIPESLEPVPLAIDGQPLSGQVMSVLQLYAAMEEITPRARQTLDAIEDALGGRSRHEAR